MLGNRLREERERVGMTQPVFAEAAGAKKRTLIDWEKGVSSPTAMQLEALAEIGVDVLYVLTGERATGLPPGLSAEEQLLVESYRALPVAKRKTLLADLLTGAAGKPVARRTSGVSVTGNNNRSAGGNYNEKT